MNIRTKIAILSLITLYTISAQGQVPLDPACAESVQRYGVSGFSNSEFVWSFDRSFGEVVEGNGTDTISIRWGYNTGRVILEVLEITNENCSNVPSQARIEIIAPYVDLGYNFPEICEGDSLTLDVGEFHAEPYEITWHNGSHASKYTSRVSEDIWVRVIDGYGCIRYDTVSLLVNELPSVYLGRDTILCDVTKDWELDAGNFMTYRWEYNQMDPSAEKDNPQYIKPTPSLPDTIKVFVKDYNGCTTSDTLIQLPCDIAGLFADMNNTITPNNDGSNDTWHIKYIDQFPDAVLEVFDRWGRLVYRSTNVFEEPWDGTSKGKPLPMDAYYFILDLKIFEVEPIVGTVNIIR